MKEYCIHVFVDKKFHHSYHTHLVPMIGDMISLSETEVFTVEKRMLPANDTSDVVLVFGKLES